MAEEKYKSMKEIIECSKTFFAQFLKDLERRREECRIYGHKSETQFLGFDIYKEYINVFCSYCLTSYTKGLTFDERQHIENIRKNLSEPMTI